MFGNTKKIKELEENVRQLKDEIHEMKIDYLEDFQKIRCQLYKKENIAWTLQKEEIELIEQGKKVKKIIEILK